jgi:hypothetical protein
VAHGAGLALAIGSEATTENAAEVAEASPQSAQALGAEPVQLLLPQLIGAHGARRVLARAWADARPGGWNSRDTSVGGTLRIPVEELGTGYSGNDPQPQYTRESATKRAIVVIPDNVDLATGSVEVLLHFHGQNIGYRERSKEATVRDVEVDMIEQQLVASGRNIIAVLPQGSRGSGAGMTKFSIGDPTDYVKAVLRLAAPHLPGSRLPAGGAINVGRLVMSGHSGGGPYATAYANYAQQPSSTEAEWADAPPLLLFDGINNENDLKELKQNLDAWLAEDLKWISKSADPLATLERRGLKFRSTWGTGSDPVYQQMNEALQTWLTDRFNKLDQGLDSTVGLTWRAQYRILKFVGKHDFNVGTGEPAGPADRDDGVPLYRGGGNLDAALHALRPNPVRSEVARRPLRLGGARTTAREMLRLQRTLGNRAVSRAVLARQPPTMKPETWKPLRADEADAPAGQPSNFAPTLIVKDRFAVFIPMGWIAKYNFSDPADPPKELKVHVFFGAGGVKGNNFNDLLLHGLRGASNATEWITIGVKGSATDDGQSFATPFSDADVTDCLAAANITWPVTKLRLSGHSRGMVSLVAYAAKMKAFKGVLDRVHVLDEFQFVDKAGTYHGKVESLISSGIPPDKIVGYESGDPASKHVSGVKYVKFDAKAMAAIGAVRMIQDAMALDPKVAEKAAKTTTTPDPKTQKMRTVKHEVDSLPLPKRGSLPSEAPAGTDSLQSFIATHTAELAAISAGHLGTFITVHNLTRYPGQPWVPFLAHEFFVAEMAPELYD